MANYEILYIIRGNVDEAQAKEISEKTNALLKNASDLSVDFWGLKELAYEVQKHKQGYYVILNFNGNIEDVNEMERIVRNSKDVIRFLVINKAKEKGAK